MSNFGSIHAYRSEVDQIKRYGGSAKETSIRRAFSSLINAYARPHDLLLVEELDYYNPRRHKRVTPDGTLKNVLRLDYGFWESKDTDDDLNNEIAKKFDKGYPDTNILFEDSETAILYQDGQRLLETRFTDDEALDQLLTTYVSFEHPEVREFKAAVERFKQDIPSIVVALRAMILKQGKTNAPFRQRRQTFLELCQSAINPSVTPDDVDEMLIQHILTEEIFISIFSETQFLDENNIARELKQVENTFFTGSTKRETLGQIKHYYECIKAHATSIVSPREKQTFLKVIYENFYKAYNPKGADRLGIVYTPGEIIDFMIRSTETLLHRHFGRGLADKGVEILDPATGPAATSATSSSTSRAKSSPANTRTSFTPTKSPFSPTTSPTSISRPPTPPRWASTSRSRTSASSIPSTTPKVSRSKTSGNSAASARKTPDASRPKTNARSASSSATRPITPTSKTKTTTTRTASTSTSTSASRPLTLTPAPRKRPSSTTCIPASFVGRAIGYLNKASWPSSPIVLLFTKGHSMVFERS